ncbi:MAG: 2-oxoacid:acceptor oxidoreductase subunit alpha [Bacteroidota bacterium]
MKTSIKKEATVLFAGDSGDGIQLTGGQFTNTTALYGNDLSTFPNFPAEIRAPQGTLAGVSGFQIKFGSIDVYTPGDQCDVLVIMNVAALKVNLSALKKGGIIIANSSGFDKKNLRLAKYEEGLSPLEDGSLDDYELHVVDVSKLTKEALKESGLGQRDIDRSKNMFVLGFVYWMFGRPLDSTIDFLGTKFSSKPDILNANITVLKAGHHYGETTESFSARFEVKPAVMSKGTYRNISGNHAIALGLVAAAEKSGLQLFYGSYPITPASTLLHELSKYKYLGVKTFQAEDEIAAICSAIGAAFGGALGVTGSSGPGIALKGEAIGLAVILEMPLVICNVQRGGPSTGLPTKTEQADLMQAIHGRNGEAPLPVLAAHSPSDAFDCAFEASRIAVEHMTPVILLSDGYIANGSEPWKFPSSSDLEPIKPPFAQAPSTDEDTFLPYKRDGKLVRKWAIPGMEGLIHRIGGLEKENETGNVSYDPDNHEFMIKTRAEKVAKIAEYFPEQTLDSGEPGGSVLVLGWGSTYGAIKTAIQGLIAEGHNVAHAHVRCLNPFPSNLEDLLRSFDKVLIPEINDGQLLKIIRSEFLIDAIGLNKIKGVPFTANEIREKVLELI